MIDGEKWWSYGDRDRAAPDLHVMVSSPDAPAQHQQHSMIWSGRSAGHPLRPCRCMAATMPAWASAPQVREVARPASPAGRRGQGFEIRAGGVSDRPHFHHCMRGHRPGRDGTGADVHAGCVREASAPAGRARRPLRLIAHCDGRSRWPSALPDGAMDDWIRRDAQAAAPWISQNKVVSPQVALPPRHRRSSTDVRRAGH